MELLNKHEHVFGRFAIAHLALYIVAGQIGCFVLGFCDQQWLRICDLIPDQVLSGDHECCAQQIHDHLHET